MTGPGDLLGQRALNRATLARQLLLRRWDLPATAAVERLGGLNGQDFEPPYIGLWTRLAGFEHQALTRALEDRSVVRGSLLRATQHLVTAADYLAWQPLLQPVLERSRRTFAWGTAEVDLDELAWGVRGPTPFVLAESWLGRSLAPAPTPGGPDQAPPGRVRPRVGQRRPGLVGPDPASADRSNGWAPSCAASRIVRTRGQSILEVQPLAPLPKAALDPTLRQGERLLKFAVATDTHDIRVLPPEG